MKHVLTLLVAFGLAGSAAAWAQDVEKKAEGKQDAEKKPVEKDGGGVKKAAPEGEPSIPVKDVDTNGDGMISASELKAALGKLGGFSGDKKGIKPDGGDKKAPLKDGFEKDGLKKVPPKDGDGDKKAPPKDGVDGVKKAPPKDGEGEKKAPAQDGGGVKKAAPEGEPSIPVKDVDTNGDGMISASELKAALGKFGGTSGDKKGIKPDGGDKKVPLKDGFEKDGLKKVPPKDGDGDKKAPPKDGVDGVKKVPPKDGDGDKKAPPKESGDKTGGK